MITNTSGKKIYPAYFLFQTGWSLIDWVYPPHCAGCGVKGFRWCTDCQENTERIPAKVCSRCGGKLFGEAEVCPDCKKQPPRFEKAIAWGFHSGPLQNAVHNLKYKRDLPLGDSFSKSLVDYIEEFDWKIDIVIPVPLGIDRHQQRGYNQAALLAKPIAYRLSVQYQPKSLVRIRETRSQVGLNRQERKENVAGAFQADNTILQGKNILLVDDVMTTGGTVNSAADALKHAGANKVFVITLARAK